MTDTYSRKELNEHLLNKWDGVLRRLEDKDQYAEIKRLKSLFFERRDCRDGHRGDWCVSCDMFDIINGVCIVDLEPAPVKDRDAEIAGLKRENEYLERQRDELGMKADKYSSDCYELQKTIDNLKREDKIQFGNGTRYCELENRIAYAMKILKGGQDAK